MLQQLLVPQESLCHLVDPVYQVNRWYLEYHETLGLPGTQAVQAVQLVLDYQTLLEVLVHRHSLVDLETLEPLQGLQVLLALVIHWLLQDQDLLMLREDQLVQVVQYCL